MKEQDLNIIINPETGFNYLMDSWRRAELMKKHWAHRLRDGYSEAEAKMVNCQLLIDKCYAEIERRADKLETSAVLALIDTQCAFTLNL